MENRMRALIADGSEEFCEHLRVTLERECGCEVVGTAQDGIRAVSL